MKVSGYDPIKSNPDQTGIPSNKTQKRVFNEIQTTTSKLGRPPKISRRHTHPLDFKAQEIPPQRNALRASAMSISKEEEKENTSHIIRLAIDSNADLSNLSDQEILQAIKYSTKYIEDKNNKVIATKTHINTGLSKQELIDLVKEALKNLKNSQIGQDVELTSVASHPQAKYYAAFKLNKNHQLSLKLFRVDEKVLGTGGTGVVKEGKKITGREIVQKSAVDEKGKEKIGMETSILDEINTAIEANPELKRKFPDAWDSNDNLILIQTRPETKNLTAGRYSTQKHTEDLHHHLKNNDEYKRDPFKYFLPLAKDLATGMAILHASNYIHSDFKSSNMLITKDKRVVISDLEGSKKLTNGAFTEEQKKRPLTAISAAITSSTLLEKISEDAILSKDKKKFNEDMKAHDRFSLGVTLYTGFTGISMPANRTRVGRLHTIEISQETFNTKEFLNLPPMIQIMLKRLLTGDLSITPDDVLRILNSYNETGLEDLRDLDENLSEDTSPSQTTELEETEVVGNTPTSNDTKPETTSVTILVDNLEQARIEKLISEKRNQQ